MLELYHTINSVCAQKVRIHLEEKALPWNSRLMTLRGDQFDPAYIKLNPNAVVPTLVHDGEAVIESSVILYYLEDVFPTPSLMPADPRLRMKVRLYNKLIDEKIHNACTVLTFATALRPNFLRMEQERLDAYLSEAPDKRRSSFKRDVISLGLKSTFCVEAVEHYVVLLKWISDSLTRSAYLADDSLSLADIAVFPYIYRLDQLGLSRMWERHAEIDAWYKRVGGRPSVLAAIASAMTEADRAIFENGKAESWPMVAVQEAFRGWAAAA